MNGKKEWGAISQMLHDARLLSVTWDEALGRVTLDFNPMRRDVDGSELADPIVTFHLNGVAAIVVGYESGICGIRPSEYRLDRQLEREDLRDWPFAWQEPYVSVNSPACLEEVLGAPLVRWLYRGPDSLDDCEVRLGVAFSHSSMLGLPTNDIRLLFGCDGLEIFSAGLPLDLDTWAAQLSAWGKFWVDYWNEQHARQAEGPDEKRAETIIPAGASPPPDRSYRPPSEPVVEWEPTDLAQELLQVLTDWMEATHNEDWLRLARVHPSLDLTREERAAQLADWAEHTFGRWWYARQVDSWWMEERHAEVVVRGVEHNMPEDEIAAENVETVWTVRLRRGPADWIIRTWVQGWPPYGSAPDRPVEEKPWLGRWSSGAIRSSAAEEEGDDGVV